MKKINHFKSVVLIIISTCTLLSCTKDFEDINTNPNQSTENPSLDLLFGSIVPGFIGESINSYNRTGQFTQQFAVKNSEHGILTQDDDADSRRTWERFYTENGGAIRNIEFLSFEAQKTGNDVYLAISKILKAYALSQLTDLFGDIPYQDAGQAFKAGNQYFLPKYDSQEEVYNTMLAELKSANNLLANASEVITIDEKRDFILSGDRLKWRKFANSLRLRLIMRISKVKNVATDFAEIINNTSENPIISSLNDEPVFSYSNAENWPFDVSKNNVNNNRISDTFVNIMKGNGGINQISTVQDPRLSWLLNPTEASIINGSPEFVGQPIGVATDTDGEETRSLLSNNFKNLNKFWLITYAEVNFLKAEAISKGFISGNAADFYRTGVTASIQKYEIDVTTTQNIDYINNTTDNFIGNENLHIAIQRLLDQINNGFEGYAVWRRMNAPTLTLGPDVVASQIPTRYFYSSKTTDKNQANADAAIARAPLNGSNTIFDNVWWDID